MASSRPCSTRGARPRRTTSTRTTTTARSVRRPSGSCPPAGPGPSPPPPPRCRQATCSPTRRPRSSSTNGRWTRRSSGRTRRSRRFTPRSAREAAARSSSRYGRGVSLPAAAPRAGDRPDRVPVRAGHLALADRQARRLSGALRGPPELCLRPRRRHLPRGRQEHARVHRRLARPQGAHRTGHGAGPQRRLARAELLPRPLPVAVDHVHRRHRAHLALDVRRVPRPRLLQQRADRHRPHQPSHRLHGHAGRRHGRRHRGQLVARVPVLRRVVPGGHAGHPAGAVRRGLRRRRRRLAPVPPRDAAGAAPRHDRDDRAVVHPHHQRLQHRVRDDARRPGHGHPGLRHLFVRGRLQPAALGARRDDLDLPRARPDRRHRPRQPLSPEGPGINPMSARLFTLAGIVLFLLIVLVPFWWIASMSFKTYEQIQFATSIYVPKPFIWDNYTLLWTATRFPLWLRNSVVTAVLVTLLTTVVASLAGYAIARLRFPGRESFASLILVLYLVPPALLFIPLYRVLAELGATNSLAALVLSYPTFTVPFCTWLLIGFFKALPRELEEAAFVDGASRTAALTRVLLPLAAPGIVASAIFAFTLSWNEFLYALVFIQDETRLTVPVGLNLLIYGDVFSWGQLMAASVITTLPVVALYMFIHRWMVEGLAAGSVKG